MRRKKATAAGKPTPRPGKRSGAAEAEAAASWQLNPKVIAGRMGWPGAGRGRSANLDRGTRYIGTTAQVGGLYPFVLGAGLPPEGVPIGPDMLTNELVCFDPGGWVGRLTQNPGVWIMAQPGAGKSAITKRITMAYSAYGYKTVVPGDVKGEYAPIVRALGGQVVRIGRGLDRLNPLDSGPLRPLLPTLSEARREPLLAEINGRRAELLQALLATEVGLGRRPTATESNVVTHAIRVISEKLLGADPVIPDVVALLRDGSGPLWSRLMVNSEDEYRSHVREVTLALENLCDGPLAGVFDGPTTTPVDLAAPALSVDLSSLLTAGNTVVAAGLLATWAYAYSSIDSARAVGMMNRPMVLPLDEMWRALRAGTGMVDAMDSMTRLNRSKGEVSIFITHSLRDPESLPTAEDRAKALGLMDRCDSLILGALSQGELERVSAQRPLTDAEMAMVASWSSPTITGVDGTTQQHRGRGKYLIKIGTRAGTPARLELTDAERGLFDTDAAMRKGKNQ
ncbi:ATP-binding protein [Streptomyces sp. NPDC051162]|uniref:ATP-binding protein n=1 Tax=Streptomyces sp. NPDC051162 TaxID=3154747 RepID=UPI00342E0F57